MKSDTIHKVNNFFVNFGCTIFLKIDTKFGSSKLSS